MTVPVATDVPASRATERAMSDGRTQTLKTPQRPARSRSAATSASVSSGFRIA